MNDKEKKDLALSKVVLVVLGALGLLLILYLSWLAPGAKETDITSFSECVKAGNPIQDSYPEVCRTKDGKSFPNPDHNIQSLAIKEWGATLMISGVFDAYYTYDTEADTVFLSTRTLDAAAKLVKGCTSGLHGITYQRVQLGDAKGEGATWAQADLADAAKVGNYYYVPVPIAETLCLPDPQDSHVTTANTHKAALEVGMRSAQPE